MLKSISIVILMTGLFYHFKLDYNQDDVVLPAKCPDKAFVVIELFTSQGCSSCPAADALLKKVTNLSNERQLPVYTLSFHVDYWDKLGWKDSFSDQKNTQRQYAYGRAFSRQNIYTPQMIINGTYEFVGSDKSLCEEYISSELSQKRKKRIPVSASYSLTDNKIHIDYSVPGTFSGFVNFAVLQKKGKVDIKSGENGGRSINYTNIVRQFTQIDCYDESNKGEIGIDKPVDLDGNNMTVLVYLQNKLNMKVEGVKEARPL